MANTFSVSKKGHSCMASSHSTQARTQFLLEFGAAVRAIRKMEAQQQMHKVPLQRMQSLQGLETTTHREFQREFVLPSYFDVEVTHRMKRDPTTDFNEAQFRQRNIDKLRRW